MGGLLRGDAVADFVLVLLIDRSSVAYALAGCGRRCDTLFAESNGAFPVDTERVSHARSRRLLRSVDRFVDFPVVVQH